MKNFFAYLTAILFTILFAVTFNTLILAQLFNAPDFVIAISGFLIGWNMPKFIINQLLPQDKQSEETEEP